MWLVCMHHTSSSWMHVVDPAMNPKGCGFWMPLTTNHIALHTQARDQVARNHGAAVQNHAAAEEVIAVLLGMVWIAHCFTSHAVS